MEDFYQPVAEAQGVDLTAETTRLDIKGDQQLLAQAVTNLLDNALKYAPAGSGRVEVRLHNGRLTFDDNAPGLRVRLWLPLV